jgi:hypothetical protein
LGPVSAFAPGNNTFNFIRLQAPLAAPSRDQRAAY